MGAARKVWAGVGICVGAATLLCLLLNNSVETRFVAPAVSLQAVIFTALYFGRTPALIGSVATSVILTLFLFPPVGSVLIRDPLEIAMLLLFQLASIAIAFMSPRIQLRRLIR
jgi:K+-sensing histidine kinase KdpD